MISGLLYSSIWIALWLFVAGEAGKRRESCGRSSAWARPLWTLGAVVAALHVFIALFGWHGGGHRAALDATARQTEAVYGISWGGGLYVNYVFIALWAAEALWWRAAPARYLDRPVWMIWTSRAFYFLIVLNAAVIFASAPGRLMGVPLAAALAWYWRPSHHRLASASL